MPTARRPAIASLTLALALQAVTLLASDPARERQLQQGNDLLEKNRPREAASMFEEVARSTDPEIAAFGLLGLGDAQRRMGKTEDARRTYSQIITRYEKQRRVVERARQHLASLPAVTPVATPRSWLVLSGDDADAYAYLTPDGRLMSRMDTRRSGDVVVRDMVAGRVTRMRVKKDTMEISPDHAELPMISPDGKKILFVWVFRDERKGTTRNQLKVMSATPGAAATLLVEFDDSTFFEPIGWSQDGQSVLITVWRSNGDSEFAWVSLKQPSRLEVFKSLGQRLVLGRSRPRLSPDGAYLTYAAFPGTPTPAERQTAIVSGPMHLYLLPLNGDGEIELVRNNINESPVWAPDGRQILFVSNRSPEGYSLWSVGVGDQEVSHVAARIQGRIRPISMTRNGTLYYVPEPGGGYDVHVADVDPTSGRVGSRRSRLVDTLADRNLAPSWSPDGRSVAYKRRRMAGTVPRALEPVEVVVYSGTSEAGAYTFAGLDDSPAMWVDSKRLLVRRVNGRLFQLNLERGTFTPIESVAHSVLPPECGTHALAPDGRTLYLSVLNPAPAGTAQGAVAARRRIVAFDVTSGDQRDILPPQPFQTLSVLAVAPDGRSLAISLMRESWKAPRLAIVSVDGTLRELATTIVPRAASWTRAGLFVARGDTDRTEIVRVSLEDGKANPTGLAHARGLSFDISRDGSRVVYGELTRSNVGELWGYENLLARAKQVN